MGGAFTSAARADELDPLAGVVRAEALDLAVRNVGRSEILALPLTLLLSMFFWNQTDRAALVVWVAIATTASVVTWAALRWFHRGGVDGRPRRTAWPIVVATALNGIAWGFPVFLVQVRNDGPTFLFLLFPFGASLVNIIVAAPSRTVFIAFQLSLITTVTVGVLTDGSDVAVGIVGAAWAWFVASLVLHQVVYEDSRTAITLRHRTAELVERLDDERIQLAEANDRLQHQATHDPLTDLPNRRAAMRTLDLALQEAMDEGHKVGLIYLDLDRFKAVNDALGHRAGDLLLQVVADRLTRMLPPGGEAARLGGDEIIVVLPNRRSLSEVQTLADRIAAAVAEPMHLDGREVATSTSMGIALGPDHGTTGAELLRHANAALHVAKATGRNRWYAFDAALRQRLDQRIDDEQELRHALDHGDIVPFFQPEIDASTGRVVGAEVLARWLRRGTTLEAAAFIDLARETGLLPRLQSVVIGQARPEIRRFHLLGLPGGFRFRINLSPRPAGRPWEPELVHELINGVPNELITLDITEQLVLDDVPRAAGALATLRAEGLHIGLDNFGKGASAIALLRRLPLDEVRIDRETIDGITTHPHDRAIVRSIVALVRELGLAITAEGIETATQADALLALGCSRQAGHLYAPALPVPAFEQFLIERELQVLRNDGDTNWSTEQLS